jgi:hypothetical protein
VRVNLDGASNVRVTCASKELISTCLPANLPTIPADLLACLPACLLTCLPFPACAFLQGRPGEQRRVRSLDATVSALQQLLGQLRQRCGWQAHCVHVLGFSQARGCARLHWTATLH